MMELTLIRPAYETRGTDDPVRFPDAHRLLRMAIAVGEILPLPIPPMLDVSDILDRVGGALDDDEVEHRFSTRDVALLADVLAQVDAELDAALDMEWHPRGKGGELIAEEATRPKTFEDGTPDSDRIFEMHPDGRISTVYPRMSLVELEERLPELIEFMRDAGRRGLEIAIVS